MQGLGKGFASDARQGIDKAFGVGGTDFKIETHDAFDGGGHGLGGQALAGNDAQRRLLIGAAAEQDLVEFDALLVDAQYADMADMVVAAGIDAARYLDLQVADLVAQVSV